MNSIAEKLIKYLSVSGITLLFPTGDEGFLIFANRQDIRHLSFDSSDYTQLIPHQRGAIALDFDFKTRYIFWTDVMEENIKRARIEENPQVEVLVKINLNTPDGIAVDWINRKLYWTDTGIDMIEAADFNGTNRLVLVKTGLEEPRAIVVHPFVGYVKSCLTQVSFFSPLVFFPFYFVYSLPWLALLHAGCIHYFCCYCSS